ncbi:hypothetical protein [Streptomyces sporangiiformans]|uniref:hypothetical protein n=1 Tax=Streptomyces sporangiiformans TaxID=2315329 RepID=UPI001F09D40A|nr:hypothetical protein [Streptomyces sporangiiformans]
MYSPITGTAAGVPFTTLPPNDNGAARLIVTWHMLDARTVRVPGVPFRAPAAW